KEATPQPDELRPLQDVRPHRPVHQHPLGRPRGRRRSELQPDVTGRARRVAAVDTRGASARGRFGAKHHGATMELWYRTIGAAKPSRSSNLTLPSKTKSARA